jgi:hypothetical protein
MYGDTTQVWYGLMRLGAVSLPWLGGGALVTALFMTAVMTPLQMLLAAWRQDRDYRWPVFAWTASAIAFVPWARRFGSAGWALLAPPGALLVQLTAVIGLSNRLLRRGLRWKDRVVY